MSARGAERVYALLLRAYPAGFRAHYEREMRLVFRDLVRERGVSAPDLWLETITDVARSAPALRVEALRARRSFDTRLEGRRMKPMGIVAALIGLLQVVNAIIELRAGGRGLGGTASASVILAVAVGTLLVVAGIAMVRRSPHAALLARIAAVSWLVLAAIVRVVYPWMSVATTILAVVFPLVLLVFLWTTRGRGQAASA